VAELQWTPAGTEPAAQIYDCWNTIGVSGNGSCRELPRFTHCRNCPVYASAAAQLLDRPVTPELRREWMEHFAREKKLTASARTSLVIFRIGPEWLALPTPAFQEVAESRTMHTLPHRRHGVVLGLANIRGELLICASLGRLLGVEPEAARARSRTVYERLLVANWDGSRLVFPVDEVHGIHRVHDDELRAPPATVAKSALSCTRSVFPWCERTVGLLDAEVLFATLNRNLT
jgi:chemotaxis-related protein WspD